MNPTVVSGWFLPGRWRFKFILMNFPNLHSWAERKKKRKTEMYSESIQHPRESAGSTLFIAGKQEACGWRRHSLVLKSWIQFLRHHCPFVPSVHPGFIHLSWLNHTKGLRGCSAKSSYLTPPPLSCWEVFSLHLPGSVNLHLYDY